MLSCNPVVLPLPSMNYQIWQSTPSQSDGGGTGPYGLWLRLFIHELVLNAIYRYPRRPIRSSSLFIPAINMGWFFQRLATSPVDVDPGIFWYNTGRDRSSPLHASAVDDVHFLPTNNVLPHQQWLNTNKCLILFVQHLLGCTRVYSRRE
jgi:hypothetical protein